MRNSCGARAAARVMVATLLWEACAAGAQIPGLPQLPGNKREAPTLPSIPALNLPGMGSPQQQPVAPAAASDNGSSAIPAAMCLALGAGGAVIAKKMVARDTKRLNLTPQQTKQRETSMMLGFALGGCAVGAGVSAAIIKNMSASAKKAQDDAWHKAQQQTGPVTWSDPNNARSRGSTELTEREKLPDGTECGTRKDVIEAEEGTANPMQRVCRQVGSNDWKPVTAA